ncbi:MAG: tRNA (adenosine(37)-N6)-dimethylallyltransferase MiaA [Gemmatimonadales bacterium]
MPAVLVLTGATGVGKTRVATALAALADIEVVSADSRQTYRGLDIGTAKPSAAERAAAPYHGLDLVAPVERYSAGAFAADAGQWIAAIEARRRLPVVVGGTGFYLRALFEGLFEEPPLEPERRRRLRGVLGSLPGDVLTRWARRLDAAFRGGGRQRAARAVEVALLSGRPLSRLQAAPARAPGLVAWYAVLALPRSVLAARIAERTRRMLEAGLVAEVRRLLAAGVAPDAPGLTGVGYREVVAHLSGALPLAELPEAIAAATRRYAKRQETWFRHQLRGPVLRLDAAAAPEALAREVLARYRAAAS